MHVVGDADFPASTTPGTAVWAAISGSGGGGAYEQSCFKVSMCNSEGADGESSPAYAREPLEGAAGVLHRLLKVYRNHEIDTIFDTNPGFDYWYGGWAAPSLQWCPSLSSFDLRGECIRV